MSDKTKIKAKTQSHFAGRDYIREIKEINIYKTHEYMPCGWCQKSWVLLENKICNDCYHDRLQCLLNAAHRQKIVLLFAGIIVLIMAHLQLSKLLNTAGNTGFIVYSLAIGFLCSVWYLLFCVINNRLDAQKDNIGN